MDIITVLQYPKTFQSSSLRFPPNPSNSPKTPPKMPIRLPGNRPGITPGEISAREHQLADLTQEEIDKLNANLPDVMMYNNTSASYRAPKIGYLFVQKPPHEIRALAHTGVDYRYDEEEKEYTLELNDPVELPEYERTSLKLKTGHNLCFACLDVFNYYCKYIDAYLAVTHPFPPPSPHTNTPSTKLYQQKTAQNSRLQIQSFIIKT
jgi:hypothetical protein